VLAMADGHQELLEPLVTGLPYLAVEALWAVRREMALSVSDVLDRRTQSSYRDARAAADAAPAVAALIGPELGWTGDRSARESEAYAAGVRARLVGAGLDPAWGGPDRATPAGAPGPAAATTGTGTADSSGPAGE